MTRHSNISVIDAGPCFAMPATLTLILALILPLILTLFAARSASAQLPARPPSPHVDVRAAAASARELRVIVSVAKHRLWVVRDSADTLRSAPVAVGSGRTLRDGDRTWTFVTPRGVHAVLSTETDPLWVRPDWAYVEVARQHHLRLDSVSVKRPRPLADGGTLVVRQNVVGVLRDSTFEPWPIEDEIAIDGMLYIPPIGSVQRAVPNTLGRYRLNIGDGYGIHGTPDHASIGRAVTHGCMRLGDDDLEWLFYNVPVGTPVFIY